MFPRKVMSYGANEDGVHVIEVKREGLRCELLRLHLRSVHGTDGSRSARVRAEPLPRVHATLLWERGLQARREHTDRSQGSGVLGLAQGPVDIPQCADAQTGEQAEAIVRAVGMPFVTSPCSMYSIQRLWCHTDGIQIHMHRYRAEDSDDPTSVHTTYIANIRGIGTAY